MDYIKKVRKKIKEQDLEESAKKRAWQERQRDLKHMEQDEYHKEKGRQEAQYDFKQKRKNWKKELKDSFN